MVDIELRCDVSQQQNWREADDGRERRKSRIYGFSNTLFQDPSKNARLS